MVCGPVFGKHCIRALIFFGFESIQACETLNPALRIQLLRMDVAKLKNILASNFCYNRTQFCMLM